MCDSSAAAISVSTGGASEVARPPSACWPSENVGTYGLRFQRLCSSRSSVGRAVLEPGRPARDRLEREQPVVVRLVDLERDLGVVGAQAVEHRHERVVDTRTCRRASGPDAVEPHQEVELEVAHAPATRSPCGCGSRRAGSRPAPTARARPRSSRCPDRPRSTPARVADRVAHPLRMLRERLRRRVEVHRAHPQTELHRRDRLAHRAEVRIREPRLELRLRACRPSAARDTAASPASSRPSAPASRRRG